MVDCIPSECEEPVGSDEILSYSDKYMSKNKTGSKGMASTKRRLPAELTEEKRKEIQDLAVKTFKILGCSGVSRIDFLVDKVTDKVYVNEINTIPGALSYYLWEATNKTFEQEIDEIIQLALKRQREKEKVTYSYDQNILAMNGTKLGMKGKA